MPVFGQGQETWFQQWNIEDGLSNQVIRNIAQDSRGFLWLTTEQGLNRFDGETFRHYINVPGDSNSISHNLLFGLAIDQRDIVWVGTDLGLNAYNLSQNQWTRFQNDPNDPTSLSDNHVRSVFVDARNNVWVGTENGLNLYDREKRQFVRLMDDRQFPNESDQKSFSYNRINDIYEDKKGRIWVGLDGGGARIYESDSWTAFTPFFVRDTLQSRTRIVRRIFEDSSGEFWFGTDAGLARYSGDLSLKYFFSPASSPDSLSDQYVWDMLEGPEGHLWVSTYRGGVNVLDRNQNKFIKHFNSENKLSGDQIWHMLKDKDGGVWVGCDGAGGLNYHHPALKKFEHHLAEGEVKYHIENVYEYTPETVLVSTSEGLLQYDLRNRTFGKLTDRIVDESEYFFMELVGEQTYLMSGNSIFQMNSNGTLSSVFRSDIFRPRTIVTATHVDEFQNIWIGSISQGLLKVNLKTREEQLFFGEGNSNLYLDSRSIRMVAPGPDDKLWVASARSGLFLLDPASDEFEPFLFHTDLLYEPTITSILPESDTVLWLGTQANGLVRFSVSTQEVSFFRSEEKPLSQQITGMLQGEEDVLWISTKNGFARFDKKTQKFHVFNSDDGLQSSLFSTATHKGKSGRLYFGGSNGFNVIEPENIRFNEVIPEVYFENLSINDALLKPGHALIPNGLDQQTRLSLAYDQNYIKLKFTGPVALQAKNTQYEYRLSGDQPWQDLEHSSELSLPNLPVGEYDLAVRAGNSDGRWGSPSILSIDILPPFWETTWFRALVAFSLITCVVGFYRYRLKRISNQKKLLEKEVADRTKELQQQKEKAEKDREIIASQAEELKELDKVKSKFFANISHELRTPLTLINGPLESFLEREGHKLDSDALSLINTASQNGESLYGLVEEILDLTKLESGKLPLVENPILLHELLMDTFDAYRFDLKEKGVAATLDIQLPEDTCLSLDGRKVKKVLNNLLSNARKFTDTGGEIALKAFEKDAKLFVTVRDTGRGIDPSDIPHVFDRFYQSKKDGKAEGGTGIGLALSMELTKLMGGRLGVSSKLGEGSEFIFELPFKPAALQELDIEVEDRNTDLAKALNQVVMNYVEFFNIDQPTLLLAEDNSDMRKFIARVFDGQFRILEAREGGEALQYLESERVDLMISDVMMPGMDGFELLNVIKTREQLRSLSIIMLTARAAEEDKLFALTKGVDDYLTKPFNKAELLARVKNILENRVNRHEIDPERKGLNIDQQFLLNLQKVVEKHMDHHALSVSFLSDEVALSQRQLQRKIKEITGLSPLGFIKEIRLQKAYRLLANREIPSVSEAARKVGFEKADYFSSQFIARFGKRPSSML